MDTISMYTIHLALKHGLRPDVSSSLDPIQDEFMDKCGKGKESTTVQYTKSGGNKVHKLASVPIWP
jgi:hypothetical protein